MIQHIAIYVRTRTEPELLLELRRAVENPGAIVVSAHVDDGRLNGRSKYGAWRKLIETLNEIDQIVLLSAADLPGRRLDDLLKILATLRDHGVGLYLHDERIDTGSSGFALLDLIEAYRRAKLSQAIRNGQAKALPAGKRIGRPIVPQRVQDRIRVALTNGGGVRPTARRFNVSLASVINIRRTHHGEPMHLLLIILVLVFTFPLLARIAGSILSIVFWLVVAGTVVAIVEVAF